MAVTMQEVRAVLEQDEPQYEEAAQRFGAEALPILEELVKSEDAMIASKATYLAAYINEAQTGDVLMEAARSSRPLVRVAAAGALRMTSNIPDEIVGHLMDDQDAGVRKTALQSIQQNRDLMRIGNVRERIAEAAQHEPETFLRQFAAQIVEHMDD